MAAAKTTRPPTRLLVTSLCRGPPGPAAVSGPITTIGRTKKPEPGGSGGRLISAAGCLMARSWVAGEVAAAARASRLFSSVRPSFPSRRPSPCASLRQSDSSGVGGPPKPDCFPEGGGVRFRGGEGSVLPTPHAGPVVTFTTGPFFVSGNFYARIVAFLFREPPGRLIVSQA